MRNKLFEMRAELGDVSFSAPLLNREKEQTGTYFLSCLLIAAGIGVYSKPPTWWNQIHFHAVGPLYNDSLGLPRSNLLTSEVHNSLVNSSGIRFPEVKYSEQKKERGQVKGFFE